VPAPGLYLLCSPLLRDHTAAALSAWAAGIVSAALTGGGIGLHWAIGYGSTAATLATTETGSFANNTTKIARKVPLGVVQWFAATAA
jgi:uncharacterized protein YcfJ